jgi:hypothetical protein
MKPTQEIIDQFAQMAEGSFQSALIVGFEAETKYVFKDDPNQVAKLDALILQGGQPIGVIRLNKDGRRLNCSISVFEEWEGQDWINGYVDALGSEFVRGVAQEGGVKIGPVKRFRPGLN